MRKQHAHDWTRTSDRPAEWLRIHGHVDSTIIIILFDPLVQMLVVG